MKQILIKTMPVLILLSMLLSIVGCSPQPAAPQPAASAPKVEATATTAAPKELEKVNLQLNWTVTGDHSPYYVAIKKGWFKDAGLDVNIIVGKGSGYSVQTIDAGKADIAIADAPVAFANREKGAKVKIIGVIYDKHPNGAYYWKDSGIKEPKDLAGKTIAVPATDGHKVMWPAFAKQIGVDPNGVQFVNIEPAAKVAALASKKADVVFDLMTGKPFYEAAIPPEKLGYFMWADYGFNSYAHSYIVSENTIANKPEMLRKFLDVSYKAWEYVANHPQEAIDILAESQPINKTEYLKNLEVVLSFIETDRLRQNGLGYIDPAQMQSTYDLVNEYQAKLSFPVKDIYDTSFLPKTPYTNIPKK